MKAIALGMMSLLAASAACSSGDDSRTSAPDGDPTADAASSADATLAPDGGPAADAASPADAMPAPDGGGRPFQLQVPAGYDPAVPAPLVILLHGYSSSGAAEAMYFQLGLLVDREGFLFAVPDGTRDVLGNLFWNATDACCDLGGIPVDDVAYIGSIIDQVSARYSVDAKRVYLVGHSNGGFMAHRTACDLSSRIAAIVSLAGAQWKDPARCQPTSPVAVLEVHGDADQTIHYQGGSVLPNAPPYPSAAETVATWAAKNGCTGDLIPGATLDLVSNLPAEETQVASYTGCRAAVELWTIRGGPHIPRLNAAWPEAIYGFLKAHPKGAGP